jgi:hypothetical protein
MESDANLPREPLQPLDHHVPMHDQRTAMRCQRDPFVPCDDRVPHPFSTSLPLQPLEFVVEPAADEEGFRRCIESTAL